MQREPSELARQHEAHKAVRAKLWGTPPKRKPLPVQRRKPKPLDVSKFETRASFHVFSPATDFVVPEITVNEARPSMQRIALKVLESFPGVTLDDLKGPRRARRLVVPRQLAMYAIITQRKDLSFPTVGKFFRRDHTTVIYAVKKMLAFLEADESALKWTGTKSPTVQRIVEAWERGQ